MVTGFNTDVQHRGKTYHVQTEDKGLQNPIIETLIYMGGEILAARRTSYADLLEKEVDEKEIGERIEAQHNRMILDIREGKYHRDRKSTRLNSSHGYISYAVFCLKKKKKKKNERNKRHH